MAQKGEEQVCVECGAATPRWMGRCPACGAWGSLRAVARVAGRGAREEPGVAPPTVPAGDLLATPPVERLPSGIGEWDRVLGGGFVAGSAVLVGGEPGIGKSTLLLQVADRVAAGVSALYVTGEESLEQLARRARRVGVSGPHLRLLAETDLERLAAAVRRDRPRLLVVDSVQTVRDGRLGTPAGTIAQVRCVAGELVELGRSANTTTLLVGHVTKDGALAGPKTLEHLVDTVLSFEGDDRGAQRVVRCTKNRFGAVDELGVFEMTGHGLVEARDVSARLLAGRARGAAGSAVAAVREGRRTLLVELQALTVGSATVVPRRTVVGLEPGRAALVAAVLERWGGLALAGTDVFVAAVGGVRIGDPGADLGAAIAIASAHAGRAAPADTAWVGELGLCGDLRAVPALEARAVEAARLGFSRCVVPAEPGTSPARGGADVGLELVRLSRLGEALALLGS